jgi:glycine/D-amino acid oxidase-like deaminating enzyme
MVNDDKQFHFDVVVVGGGSAGIAAAIGAAQAGASVCLIEQYGFLGGAATNGSVLTYCGFFDQNMVQAVKGVGQKVLDKFEERQLLQTQTMPETGNTVVLLDMETTKTVYDELVTEAGITVFLHSTVISAQTDGGIITSIEAAHRGGRVTITGRAFVDSSGDGVLIAASASAEHVSEVAERQASTLVMRIGRIAEDADLSTAGMTAAVADYRARTGVELVRTNGVAVRMPVSREVMLLVADQHRDGVCCTVR